MIFRFKNLDLFIFTSESLSKYGGKVTIIVNVASYCGYTNDNYRQLTALAEKYKQNLAVSLKS